ncbi:MAG: methylmalonyl-CoA epimerase [Candidatus Bathyarchaeota archaeon]|nr:methylmalonyl-CoA epimerase [Candidatus Bathyarchaeota archaeon]
MIKRISHIGVVVNDLNGTLKLYKELLGLMPEGIKTFGRNKLAFVPVGDDEIEIIQPLDADSMLGTFLGEHGDGVHHIAFVTDDIETEIQKMRGRGVKMLNEEPMIGAHGVKIAFLSPESTNGIIIELIETASEDRGRRRS